MAQFVSFVKGVEVSQHSSMAFVNSMEKGRETRMAILQRHGIDFSKDWIPQQPWLDAFKEIAESLGEMNLFMMGRAIPKSARLPDFDNLEQALSALDIHYHLNHRLSGEVMYDFKTGKMLEGIGHYHLTEYDPVDCRAVMVCDNPYPCKFDHGLLTQLVRMYKPQGSRSQVTIDETRECRLDGADTSTYLVNW